MSVEIGEGSGEVEDELFDLNKEPVERKRKRDEKSNSSEKGNEGSNGLTKSGRVLRSMTVAMSDGEKQVIKMEIVKMDNKVETEVPLMECQDESKAPVLKKRKKKKGKRGRPRKMEDKQEVPPLSCPKKRGRGRPPKAEGKCEISSLKLKKIDGNGASRLRESRKVKRKRGRPPKTEVKCVIWKLESDVMELKNDNSSDGASQCQESPQVKRKRGRPPRMGVNCKISSLSKKQDDEAIELNKVDNSSNGAYQGQKIPKVKRKCGRPPKSGDKHEIRKQDSEVMELRKIDSSSNGAARCQESPRMKRKRGRPPKIGVKCEISSMNKNQDDEVMELMKMDDSSIGASQSQKSPKVKQKCGRPPKRGVKCEIPSLNRKQDDEVIELKKDDSSNGASQCQKGPKVKRKRGRPPKTGVNCEIPSLNRKQEDKVMEFKKIDGSCNGAAQCQESPKVKLKRGRLPKVENGSLSLVIKKKIVKKTVMQKIVKRNFGRKKTRNVGPVKRLIVGTNDLGNSVMREKKAKVDSIKGEEMGLREQKQLVRDQIIAMLYKAGWTVEYKQRLSRDYQDAVYVDREGRAYWSVTLAYKMLKARIDAGRAEDKDVLAFSPIPEETLSMLFRIVEKGKRKGKKKNGPVKIIKRKRKEESSKSRSSDGKIKSRQTLLARRPKSKNGSDTDDYEIYEGKRTLLSWMIDLGTVPLGGRVVYKRGRKQRILREGKILKEGICCNCCDITHTIRDFESHAESTLGKPFRYLFLDSGNTLFQCLVDSWKKHVEMDKIEFVCVDVEGDDPNDDTCNVCGDGGDLICCDSCPSTFHNGCLHIKVPSGDWHCDYCSCKFCGMACENTSAADDDDDQNLSSELLTCCLCEEKFHLHCINEMIAEDFQDENHSFCGKECSQILEQLHAFLGVRNELGEDFSYTILQHRAISGDAVPFDNYSNIESNSKLAVAFSVMDECFEPIVDERSGTNMIHNVVYSCGSNIRRLNYDGFYTIILEKGDELVSAASIRIHGKQLAEMPFIGTRFMYRRQGMCSRLLTAVETVLRILGVEKLIIPAISQLNQTWTEVFGFLPLEESKRQEMRYMSMIAFPGIDMLQKSVQGHQFTKDQKDSTASEHPEIKPDHQNTKENQSEDIEGLSVSSLKISHEVEDHGNGKDANSESDTTVPVVSLNEGDGRCSDNGNCLDDLNSSKNEDASLKDIMGIDCNIGPEQSDELANGCPIEGLSVSSLMISHEFEDHGNGKDANGESGTTVPVVSLNKEDGRCSDNGKCLDDLSSSKDDDASLKGNTVIDCNVGLEQSDDMANGRLNGDI